MQFNEFNKIRQFFNAEVFLQDNFDIDVLINQLIVAKNINQKIKIIYGETYDKYGLTIDSLKYYFVLHIIKTLIEKAGIEVEAVLMIGDIASIRNDSVLEKENLLMQIDKNIELIRKIKEEFSLTFDIVKLSEYSLKNKTERKIEKLIGNYSQDIEIQELLKKTILKNKYSEELKSKFKYTFEEIAIISDFDFKIGPPREIYYDQISQKINNGKPFGIYLKPTFPLGLNYDFYINNPEIEQFGLTPYKAGSNKLQDFRIVLTKQTFSEIKQLIINSYVPQYIDLPNALNELLIILNLAEAVKHNNFEPISLYNPYKQLMKNQFEQKTKIYKLFKEQFYGYFKN